MGKLVEAFNKEVSKPIRSGVITKLDSLVAFLMRKIDLSRYRIAIYYHPTHKTTHVEVWAVNEYVYPNYPKLCFEYHRGFKRSVLLPREYLK